MKLSEICEILEAKTIFGSDMLDMEFEYGLASDLMSDILRSPTEGALLITGLNTTQIIRTSVIAEIGAIVVVRGKRPDEEMSQQAMYNELPLLSTKLTMFASCGLLFSKGLKPIPGYLGGKSSPRALIFKEE